ncbi:hypothetical protein GOARA_082_00770 [Gordonia araii NBRC 100433]|uniref:Uncharacterized protein n=1 Tax=Gordonia araii NBRC 100433 TaxID=1073574 RepID=G7H763_9ACTN|nr:hypothetical protein [Gordonia araii]NNG97684.1 hypothetical protein [Gordonia araii NBRC 100433]GAB11688.1 hypothetical protein GOARA_082_00770 [Gordonia araii NBRC 100433]
MSDVQTKSYGTPTRERPDIAAALYWVDDDSANAEVLIGSLRSDELLLNAVSGWFKGEWGLFAVTSERVLLASAGNAEKSTPGFVYEMPLQAVTGIADGDVEDGSRIAQLQDYESWTKIFVTGITSVYVTDQRVYWVVAEMMRAKADELEKAIDGGVVDEYTRYRAIREAHRAGGLDNETAASAIARMFGAELPNRDAPEF